MIAYSLSGSVSVDQNMIWIDVYYCNLTCSTLLILRLTFALFCFNVASQNYYKKLRIKNLINLLFVTGSKIFHFLTIQYIIDSSHLFDTPNLRNQPDSIS